LRQDSLNIETPKKPKKDVKPLNGNGNHASVDVPPLFVSPVKDIHLERNAERRADSAIRLKMPSPAEQAFLRIGR
jgi:hypothetical protein